MEKQFETYEYLVKYNGNEENDINTGQQIVIVEDNGDLIQINKPTEYVAQEENAKEFENVACPVLDVNQQPVYFQLNNSSELIPISVNSIPTAEPTNVFGNTYLLPSMAVEVIADENDVPNNPPNLKEESENMDLDANKIPGGYAEITLNEEQYEILKQKGWILLEIKDKVFLLDSSGLHEITNDHDLITKLKHETSQIIDKSNQPSGCPMKIVMIPGNENNNTSVVSKQESDDHSEPMEVTSEIETGHQEETTNQLTQDSTVIAKPSIPQKIKENDTFSHDNKETISTKKNPDKICLKTQYLLKDIPKEIVLGKTANGKNLVARVIQGKSFYKNTKSDKDIKPEVDRDRNINDKQFAKLVQQVLLGTAGNCRLDDVMSVETVMSQMFRVRNLKPDLQKHKLIVTKTIREENEDGLIENQTEPIVVTGIMNSIKGTFLHLPDMLQEQMKISEQEKHRKTCNNENEKNGSAILEDDEFLHVNITETKDINNISRVSVMVNKRYLSLSQVYNMKTKHINAVYACTACAKVFKSEEELEDHQEYQCSEIPVSSGDKAQPYTIVKTNNEIKVYVCNNCKVKFVKLKDCQEHLRIHCIKSDPDVIDEKHQESIDKKQNEVFKCKMCDNTYFHSSSLTKHILAKHINPK